MTINRRIYKRTRTIERILVSPDQRFRLSENAVGDNFRIEIFNDSGEKIYVRELFGKVEIVETPDSVTMLLKDKSEEIENV